MTAPIDIIQAALEETGVYQPGETITAADADRSLKVFNQMLDSWSNEDLACYANLTQSTLMIINKPSYTIGPGGWVDSVRPLKITQAYLIDNLNNNTPINILTQYDWNLINNRLVTSQILTNVFYDPQYPLGILNVYPVPTGGGNEPYTIYWTSYLQLTDFANLYVDVSFPPGYVDAFQHNLAMRLYPFFGLKPDPLVAALAAETKGNVKRTNIGLDVAYYDRAIVSRAAGSYDIRSDSFTNRGSNW